MSDEVSRPREQIAKPNWRSNLVGSTRTLRKMNETRLSSAVSGGGARAEVLLAGRVGGDSTGAGVGGRCPIAFETAASASRLRFLPFFRRTGCAADVRSSRHLVNEQSVARREAARVRLIEHTFEDVLFADGQLRLATAKPRYSAISRPFPLLPLASVGCIHVRLFALLALLAFRADRTLVHLEEVAP